MNDQLKGLLDKLPIIPALVAALGYLGWTYYTFTTDPSSPLLQKQQQVASLQAETTAIKAKLQKAQDFFRTLEGRRSELRQLALQLEETKASLSEQMDVSSFVRMVVDEANKVGMTVVGIRPTENHKEEYYAQQSFELKFHGVFVQLVVFMERLANLERIVRVGEIRLKPASVASNTFVELDGVLQLNTYRYLGSKADELTKGQASTPTPSPSTATPSAAATKGGT
jgi:Tfp pilus assembly protein PilO